jgi:hypothetical protein
MRLGLIFLLVTTLLVVAGSILFISEAPGWAQALWVFASGTAGAGCVLVTEHWDD